MTLRYVTRQLFRQFRTDQFISKILFTVAVYQQISIKQCKQINMQRKKLIHIQIETRLTGDYFLWRKEKLAENVQNLEFLLIQ